MVVSHDEYENRADVWGIYRHFMNAGDEVGPWGELFEFSDLGAVPVGPLHRDFPRRFNYRRREQYPPIFLNYRRKDKDKDSEAYAGRLHEVLSHRFGPDNIPVAFSRQRHKVLLSVDTERTNLEGTPMKRGGDYPQSWVCDSGKGRVFYASFGHRDDIWSVDPVFQAHATGGIKWALGMEK
jgi:hypothetical protein